MRARVAITFVALALCSCVPVRQTYYEAVGGKVFPQETLSNCRPDHFGMGHHPGASLGVYASLKDAKASVILDLFAGQSKSVDFEPPEITVESLEKPGLQAVYPLKFHFFCSPLSYHPCTYAEFVDLPIQWDGSVQPKEVFYEHVLPPEFLAGFAVRLPKMTDDTSATDPKTVVFRRVTEAVSVGPFGCH